MRYLIVGCDPGITTGICALDLNGKLVALHSSKKFGIDQIIQFLTKIGKPVIFACDVANPPILLQKLSAIYHARLVCPREDMKVGEKQVLVQKYFPEQKIADLHQRDACAAALFAFRKFYPLFDKINFVLQREGLIEKSEEVKKKILLGEAKSIKEALIEKPDQIMLQKKKRQKLVTPPSEISLLKDQIKIQKEIIEKLKEENKKLIDKIDYLNNLIKIKSPEELVKLAEARKNTISSLEYQISKLKERISFLEEKIKDRDEELALVKQGSLIPVVVVGNLSFENILALNKSNFGDCLLVKNLTLPSQETIKHLKLLNIEKIIYEKGNKQIENQLIKSGFVLIPKELIEVKQIGNLFFASKQDIENAVNKTKTTKIEQIIEEYKKRFLE